MILYLKYLFICHQINSWLYGLHLYTEWYLMVRVVHDFVYKISIYWPSDQFLVVMTYIHVCTLNDFGWCRSSMILYLKYLFICHQINSWLYGLHLYTERYLMVRVIHDFVYKMSIYWPPDQFLVV